MIETLTCPGCRSESGISSEIEVFESAHRRYKLHQCDSCDLQFWYPRRVDSGSYQSSGSGHSTLAGGNVVIGGLLAALIGGRLLGDAWFAADRVEDGLADDPARAEAINEEVDVELGPAVDLLEVGADRVVSY